MSVESKSPRSKKRAWDRTAQRNSRQRTKARIEQLEGMVKALQNQTPSSTIASILQEKEAVHSENLRLRKVVRSLMTTLSGNQGLGTTDGQENELNSCLNVGSMHCIERTFIVHCPCCMTISSDEQNGHTYLKTTLQIGHVTMHSPVYLSSTTTEIVTNDNCNRIHDRYDLLSESALLRTSHCSVWCNINKLLGQTLPNYNIGIANSQPEDSGLLFKAIIQGWDRLTAEERALPGLKILQQMDQYLWFQRPKIRRLATAYKSHQLINYILHPGPDTRQRVPGWLLPTTIQMTEQHPCAIDFFPWPIVRNQLITSYDLYLDTCHFFLCLRLHTRFHWPYPLDASYVVDSSSKYQPSPLFMEYVTDFRNWSVHPEFFQHYPEFIDMIPAAETAS